MQLVGSLEQKQKQVRCSLRGWQGFFEVKEKEWEEILDRRL